MVTITQLVDSGSNTAAQRQHRDARRSPRPSTSNPVNDAPAGGDETIVLNEDDVHPFSASDFNFTDTDGDSLLEVVITTLPATGTLFLNGVDDHARRHRGQRGRHRRRAADLEPAANGNGTGYASFTFQVRDNGGTDNGGQNTDQTPNTITIDVTAVNDAPVNVVGATVNATEDDVNVVLSTTGSAMSVSDVEATGNVGYSPVGPRTAR